MRLGNVSDHDQLKVSKLPDPKYVPNACFTDLSVTFEDYL